MRLEKIMCDNCGKELSHEEVNLALQAVPANGKRKKIASFDFCIDCGANMTDKLKEKQHECIKNQENKK